ncbi:hypothetical protein ABRP17_010470 [Stenotrophomonas sp. WHRI 8082]|uniref:hypothetical protein n=1 Tax=Stenotrophomonas sp. WHRI 8082 TaxID=3162571 RepID=UPI0032EF382C
MQPWAICSAADQNQRKDKERRGKPASDNSLGAGGYSIRLAICSHPTWWTMNIEKFSVSLRIWHPTSAADTLTKMLNLNPSVAHSVGLARTTPLGKSLAGFYKSTYCSFSMVESTPGSFTDALEMLLGNLKPNEDNFKKIVTEGGRSEIFVGVFTESSTGFIVSMDHMRTLANLSLDLSVEIYY